MVQVWLILYIFFVVAVRRKPKIKINFVHINGFFSISCPGQSVLKDSGGYRCELALGEGRPGIEHTVIVTGGIYSILFMILCVLLPFCNNHTG